MKVWSKQLVAHHDEGIERFGLDGLALPAMTLQQTAQLIGWWRARRGIRLDRKWWRASMDRIVKLAEKRGWKVKTPQALNATAWAALEKVAMNLDRLAPAGKVSHDNALEGSTEIPGMLAEMKSTRGKRRPLALPPLPDLPDLPPVDEIIPIPRLPGKAGASKLLWLLVLFGVAAARKK